VAVGQGAQLASELRSLRNDPKRMEAMGARARDLALSRYTSEHAVTQWLGMLAAIAPEIAGEPALPVAGR